MKRGGVGFTRLSCARPSGPEPLPPSPNSRALPITQETFANVRAFAEALAAELGPSKFVYLSTVPGGAGELEEERERRHRLNELIVAYVGERSGASAGEDDGSFGGADGPKAGVYPGARL